MRKSKFRNKIEKQLIELRAEVGRLKKDRNKFLRIKHDLGERIKELNCLYSISRVMEKSELSLRESLQQIADLLPPSWQYSEVTCAEIIVNKISVRTENFKDSRWRQSSSIFVYGNLVGSVEVGYLKKRPDIDEGPFLKEERSLIDGVARQIGKFIEKRDAEEKLFQKNAALKEVIAQIEIEKRSVQEAVSANINKLIIPVLKKLKRKSSSVDRKYLEMLEKNLESLTGPFGLKIVDHKIKLTPREIEICHLIKNGMSMKEIAKMLNLSFYSVGTHRRNIRHKLGITNKKVNLPIFLKNYL